MQVVTSYYAALRRRNARNALTWHERNELNNMGYLEALPDYGNGERFSISSWMCDGPGYSNFYRNVRPTRYSELEDSANLNWMARMHPWGNSESTGREFFGYNEKRVTEYLDKTLPSVVYSRKYDSVHVVYKPHGGKPMICCVKDNKVTII